MLLTFLQYSLLPPDSDFAFRITEKYLKSIWYVELVWEPLLSVLGVNTVFRSILDAILFPAACCGVLFPPLALSAYTSTSKQAEVDFEYSWQVPYTNVIFLKRYSMFSNTFGLHSIYWIQILDTNTTPKRFTDILTQFWKNQWWNK